jgi:hypothetical protein
MYNKLAVVTRSINTLQAEYSNGNFYVVANTLTNDVYNQLCVRLGSLAANPVKFPDYETIRLMTTSALKGMYQGLLQYVNLVDTETKLKISQDHEAILYDPVRLQDWINGLRQRSALFPESKVQVRKARLKPQYAEYVRLYGFPEGGVFEPNLMNQILSKLGIFV